MSTLPPSPALISCRARLSQACEHGTPDDSELPMREDGTYNGFTVVCTSCYIELMPHTPSGRALEEEIEQTILKLRGPQAAEWAREVL